MILDWVVFVVWAGLLQEKTEAFQLVNFYFLLYVFNMKNQLQKKKKTFSSFQNPNVRIAMMIQRLMVCGPDNRNQCLCVFDRTDTR